MLTATALAAEHAALMEYKRTHPGSPPMEEPRSPLTMVLAVVDALPEATHALDNEECRLDYVCARGAALAAHGWTEVEFDAELCRRISDPLAEDLGVDRSNCPKG